MSDHKQQLIASGNTIDDSISFAAFISGIPFILYPFQERLISYYENNVCVIVKKFFHSNFRTITILWALWKCYCKKDLNILISFTDHQETSYVIHMIDGLFKYKEFKFDGKKIMFYNGSMVKLCAEGNIVDDYFNTIILDDVAFYKDAQGWTNELLSKLLTIGGKIFILSLPNGMQGQGEWFYQKWSHASLYGITPANITYKDHPYFTAEAITELKAKWQKEFFAQQIEGKFL